MRARRGIPRIMKLCKLWQQRLLSAVPSRLGPGHLLAMLCGTLALWAPCRVQEGAGGKGSAGSRPRCCFWLCGIDGRMPYRSLQLSVNRNSYLFCQRFEALQGLFALLDHPSGLSRRIYCKTARSSPLVAGANTEDLSCYTCSFVQASYEMWVITA